MLILQILILSILLLPVPAVAGTIFTYKYEGRGRLLFSWVSGQILLWAGFHFIGIPLILLEKSFTLLVKLFNIYIGVLIIAALLVWIVRNRKTKCKRNRRGGLQLPSVSGFGAVLWILFGILLILQLLLTVFMAYEEGDDAFYVAISTITESSSTMYQILPYTGTTTGLDARHGLAPFPVWVAWLARMSGMQAVTVAQIALPISIILMAYAIYYLIAVRLFSDQEKNIPYFMILAELLVLFGGYSVYSAENFLLVRASQGKAVIANIIIPFLLYLCMLLLEKMQNREKAGLSYWALVALTMTAGCLCSTQGTILCCMLIGAAGLCTSVSYRSWKVLVPMLLCCIVPVGMAYLYFVCR